MHRNILILKNLANTLFILWKQMTCLCTVYQNIPSVCPPPPPNKIKQVPYAYIWHLTNRPYAYDVMPFEETEVRRRWGGGGSIGLRVKAVVRNMPVADHKRVQGSGFDPQHGSAMTN